MILMGNLHHCKTLTESSGLLFPDTARAHRKRQALPCGACHLNNVDYMREKSQVIFSDFSLHHGHPATQDIH